MLKSKHTYVYNHFLKNMSEMFTNELKNQQEPVKECLNVLQGNL